MENQELLLQKSLGRREFLALGLSTLVGMSCGPSQTRSANSEIPEILDLSKDSGSAPRRTTTSAPTRVEGMESQAPAETGARRASPKTFNGFNYNSWWRGDYSSRASEDSLRNLSATGAKWVAITVTGYQENISSTDINSSTQKTVTDEDLTSAILTCHRLGLKVMVKPHINLIVEDKDNWRGEIGRNFTATQWEKWFESYSKFITHYANLATRTNAQHFCMGVEYKRASTQAEFWRNTIDAVRRVYRGPLVYAANFDQEYINLPFWDELDYIGVNAQFPLTGYANPAVEQLVEVWNSRGYVERLRELSTRFGKNVIFTEIGYKSVDGANIAPWEDLNNSPINLEEQANCYAAAYEVFEGLEWFDGMFWWAWEVNPNIGGINDKGYTPYKKPAERIFKQYS